MSLPNPLSARRLRAGRHRGARPSAVGWLALAVVALGQVLPSSTGPASFDAAADAPPELAATSVEIREPTGRTNVQIDLRLNRPAETRTSVRYNTADGTATAGSDYNPRAGTITFSAGQTTKLIPLTINTDSLHEEDEYFTVDFVDPVGLTVAGDATVTIADDDPEPPPTVNAVSKVIAESGATQNIRATIELTHPVATRTWVSYTTIAGTARAGFDYNRHAGVMTFRPGQTRKEITLTIHGDGVPEQDEYFVIDLFGANGVRLGSDATITIANDDPFPQLVVDVVSATVLESSTAQNLGLEFVVSTPPLTRSSVAYELRDAGAVAGEDYHTRSGRITFGPGQTRKTVPLTILGDGHPEPTETLTVALSDPVGLSVGSAGVITILDDD